MTAQAPQRSFPGQLQDRLFTDPMAIPGLIARRILPPDQDKVRAAQRQRETEEFFKRLRESNEEFRNWSTDYATNVIPLQATRLFEIGEAGRNNERDRTIGLEEARTRNTINVLGATGDVKDSLMRTAGSESRALQGVVNEGRVGEVRESGVQARGLQRTITEGDLAKIQAQMQVLESAQRQEDRMGGMSFGFGKEAFANQRAMLGDVLAHREAMNKPDTFNRLTGFVERLAPLAALFIA